MIGPNLEYDKDLAGLTSFRTGGPASYFLQATSQDDLVRAVKAAREFGIECFFLGGGSNLLVSDYGYDGLVFELMSAV